jgi:hypothetical protein
VGFKVHTSYRALIHKTIEICIDLSLIVDEFDTLQWRPELRSVSCTHGNCQISTTSNSRQIWITKGITFFWLTLYYRVSYCCVPWRAITYYLLPCFLLLCSLAGYFLLPITVLPIDVFPGGPLPITVFPIAVFSGGLLYLLPCFLLLCFLFPV